MKLAVSILLWLVLGVPDALATKAGVNAEVDAESWKSVRLRGLPKGGSLEVRVETSGPINVLLIHENELRRLPEPVRPLFAGSLERRLSFKVRLPLGGVYYVVLDNRKGAEARSIRLLIEALRPPGGAPRPRRNPQAEEAGKAI